MFLASPLEDDTYPPPPSIMEGEGVVAVLRTMALSLLADKSAADTGRIMNIPFRDESPKLPEPKMITKADVPQSCIEPYVSTYQVAHCGASARPPTQFVQEFPPQRLRPSPTLGNFEVGNGIARPSSAQDNMPRQRTGVQLDGGYPSSRKDHDVDAFVSSLRKYPSTDSRPPSAELLDRLLKTRTTSSKDYPPSEPVHKSRAAWDYAQATREINLQTNKPKKVATDKMCNKKPDNVYDTRHVTFASDEDHTNEDERTSDFDYLNSGVPWLPEGETSDNKTIENIYREIYQEERGNVLAFPVCPTLQERYERHVKLYHPSTSKVRQIDVSKLSTCTKCLKRRPCPCETARGLPRAVGLDKEEDEKQALEDAIFSWLDDIPVYPNENPQAKYIRDAVIKELTENLRNISDDAMTLEAKEQIKKAIDKLPMWYPKDKEQKDNFINNIADNLLEKVKNIKYKERFHKAVKKFFRNIILDKRQKIDTSRVLDDIARELIKLTLNRSDDDDVYRDMLKIKSFELLDRLPIKSSGNKYDHLNKLSDELVKTIMNVLTRARQPSHPAEYYQSLNECLGEILDESDAHIKNRDILEKHLYDVVNDVIAHRINNERAKPYIRATIDGKVPNNKVEEIVIKVLTLIDEFQEENDMDLQKKQVKQEEISDFSDTSYVQIRRKENSSLDKTNSIMGTKNEDKAVAHIKNILKGKIPADELEDVTDQVLTLAKLIQPTNQERNQIFKSGETAVVNNLHDRDVMKDKLKDTVKNRVKSELKREVPKDNKRVKFSQRGIFPQDIDEKVEQIIKDGIRDILDSADTAVRKRSQIQELLFNAVADVISKKINKDKALNHVKKVITGKMEEEKIHDIAKQVLTMADQVIPIQEDAMKRKDKQEILRDKKKHRAASKANKKLVAEQEKSRKQLKPNAAVDIVTEDMKDDKTRINNSTVSSGKIPQSRVDDVAKQSLTFPDPHNQIRTKIQETKQIITEKVANILDLSEPNLVRRNEIEKHLNDAVTDILSKDKGRNEAKTYLEAILKDNVADDNIDYITEQLLTISDPVGQARVKAQETKQMITEGISNILDLSYSNVEDMSEIEKELNEVVTGILTQDTDQNGTVSRIKSVLKDKVPKENVDDITKQLLSIADPDVQNPEKAQAIRESIKEDIRNILDVSNPHVKNRSEIEKELNRTVSDVLTKKLDINKAKPEIKTALKDKFDDMNRRVQSITEPHGQNLAKPLETKHMITEGVTDIIDLSDPNINNLSEIEKHLNKAVTDIVTKDLDENTATTYIKDVIKDKVPGDKVDDIAMRVLSIANPDGQILAKTRETKQMITEGIRKILDLPISNVKNQNEFEKEINQPVTNELKQDVNQNEAVSRNKFVLKDKVPKEKLDDITKRVLSIADQDGGTRAKARETNQMATEGIRNILDLSAPHVDNRSEIEKHLNDTVTDILTQDLDQTKAKTYIKTVLKGKVPDDKVDDITQQVLTISDPDGQIRVKARETRQMMREIIRQKHDLPNSSIENQNGIEKESNAAITDTPEKEMDQNNVFKGEPDDIPKQLPAFSDPGEQTLTKPRETNQKIEKNILSITDSGSQAQENLRETKENITKGIRKIFDSLDPHVKNRAEVEKHLNEAVTDILTQDMDQNKAKTYIEFALQDKIPDDKVDDIAKKVLIISEPDGQTRAKARQTKQMIAEGVRKILDLSNSNIQNQNEIEKELYEVVPDLLKQNINQNEAIIHIKSVLKDEGTEGKVDDITEHVLSLSDPDGHILAKARETHQIITEGIKNIRNLSDTDVENWSEIEKHLSYAVNNILTEDMDQNIAKSYIKTVLEGKVPDDKVNDIAKQVLIIIDPDGQTRTKAWKTKQMITEEIKNILDLSNEIVKNRNKVEKELNDALIDILKKEMDKNTAISHIKSKLEDLVSKHKSDDIIKQLLTFAGHDGQTRAKPPKTKQTLSDSPNIKNQSEMAQKLYDALTDLLTKYMNMYNNKFSEDKLDDIVKQLLSIIDPDGQKRTKFRETNKKNYDSVSESQSDNDMDLNKLQIFVPSKSIEQAKAQRKYDKKIPQDKSVYTVTEDLSNILDRTNGLITDRDKIEERLSSLLKDLEMRGMDKDKVQDQINSALKGNISDSQVADISKKILQLANQITPRSVKNMYSGGPSGSSTQNAEQMYFDQVYEEIRDWLSNREIEQLNERMLNEVTEAIANDMVDRQKYLHLNPEAKTSDVKELEILKELIFRALNKIVDNNTVLSLMTIVENLMQSLQKIPQVSYKDLVQDSIEFVQENLEGALIDWLRDSPIYRGRNKQIQEMNILVLAKSLAAVLSSQVKEEPGTKTDTALINEILKHLEQLPMDKQFKSKESISKLGDDILNYLKSLQLFQDISVRKDPKQSEKLTSLMPSTNHLNDVVNNWCKSLPLPKNKTHDESEIKQDLANKIVLKIGELNMNQDLLNDDLLYEEVLLDFIDDLMKPLQADLSVTEISTNLIEQIKNIRQEMKDNLIARAYKQRLRDTISNIMPASACTTEEDLASFDIMKDNLADAFINLHYTGNNDPLRAKFKRKIKDEINKFAKDYLNRCPKSPICTKKLNENLYNALKNVPVPENESMWSEVETVRLKDVIDDWLKTLPLSKQTKIEQLHTAKLVNILCHNLHELENAMTPDFEEIATAEIVKHLKKFPLKNKNNLDRYAKTLVDRIMKTGESRSFVRQTGSIFSDDSCLCSPISPHVHDNNGISSRASYLSSTSSIPCALRHTGTQSKKCCCKDVALDPPPSDYKCQTEMVSSQSKCCQYSDVFKPICSKTKRITKSLCSPIESEATPPHIFPRKCWDSTPGARKDFGCQSPAQSLEKRTLPSCLIITKEPRSPRQSRLPSPPCDIALRGIPLRPVCRENRCPRRPTPRKQVTSACPNDYISRPSIPRKCLQSRTVSSPSRDRRCKPSCSPKKSCPARED